MSMSDAQYAAWLADMGQQRTLLIELDHSGGTEYIANAPYISRPGDTSPNRSYDDVISEAIDISSRIDGAMDVGEITLINDGTLDTWAAIKWRGHAVRMFLGAIDWSLDDFRQVANVINDGITEISPGILRFGIRDGKAVLDQPLQSALLASGQPVPIALGEPFNVLPALTDDPTHEYQINENSITSAVVRDNGAVVSHTADYSNGKYTLSARPQGNLGTDVVEANGTAKEIINWVCTRFGLTANQTTLNALPTYTLGLYYADETTAAQVLDDVCSSLGAFWLVNAAGEVEAYAITAPALVADLTITADDVAAGQLQLETMEPPVKTLKFNYNRNFAPVARNSLAGMLDTSPALAEQLTEPWQQVSTANTVTDYPLAGDQVVDSYITGTTNAQTECDRVAAVKSQRREVWSVECFLAPSQVKIGQTVELINPRFGFANGKKGLVIAINRSYTRNRIGLELWL